MKIKCYRDGNPDHYTYFTEKTFMSMTEAQRSHWTPYHDIIPDELDMKGGRNITVVCVDAGGGHNCGLVQGLKKYGYVRTVWQNKNAHGLDYMVPEARYGFHNLPLNGNDLVIVSCITYDHLKDHFLKSKKNFKKAVLEGYDRVVVVVTDGRFARNPDYYNREFEGFEVYCNPCKIHWRGDLPAREYYQPFDLSMIDMTKYDKLTVAHSPFVKRKFLEKGTQEIIDTAKKLNVKLDIITGLSWIEALKRKAKAHIFIDQVSHFQDHQFKNMDGYIWNALGKSGLEAMHLGCLTITRGQARSGLIPTPPVAWINDNLEDVLRYYIQNPEDRKELARQQREWALEYSSYEFAAKNILKI